MPFFAASLISGTGLLPLLKLPLYVPLYLCQSIHTHVLPYWPSTSMCVFLNDSVTFHQVFSLHIFAPLCLFLLTGTGVCQLIPPCLPVSPSNLDSIFLLLLLLLPVGYLLPMFKSLREYLSWFSSTASVFVYFLISSPSSSSRAISIFHF